MFRSRFIVFWVSMGVWLFLGRINVIRSKFNSSASSSINTGLLDKNGARSSISSKFLVLNPSNNCWIMGWLNYELFYILYNNNLNLGMVQDSPQYPVKFHNLFIM